MDDPSDHPIFTTDPKIWMSYVYKEVTITTEKETKHTGWVYTVDPVSQTFVLASFPENQSPKLELVIGHCIKSIVVNKTDCTHKAALEDMLCTKANVAADPSILKKKKSLLKTWLLKNRIPIEEDGVLLTLSGVLTIEPPYGAENCCSTNQIVLGRIQGLIKNIPLDIEDWE